MPNALLFLEFLGTSELLMIAVVALLLFGPRKLPEISRTLGKSLAEFKRASDDFKRTWEYEVELERRKPTLDAAEDGRAAQGETLEQPAGASAWGAGVSGVTAEELTSRAARAQQESQTVARDSNVAEASAGGGANEGVGVASGSVAGDALADGAAASIAEGSAASDEQDQGEVELNAS